MTRWPVEAVLTHELSRAGCEPRNALDVSLSPEGQPLRVLVTHLGLRAWERREQVERLGDELHSITCPVVLLGDLNEWSPLRKTLRPLTEALGRARAPMSWPARLPVLRLDRVLVRPSKALLNVKAHRTPLSRIASDHLPVVARVRWPPR